MYFVPWAPLVAVSALTGEHTARLVRAGLSVVEGRNRRVERGQLTALIRDACLLRPPGSYRGRPINYLGAEHLPGLPPAFAVYFDHPEVVSATYLRYIENRLREAYSFAGSPLRVLARGKERKERRPSSTEE
jgi:GTP-binding protein